MKANEIVEELDRLKMLIMIDGVEPNKTDLERYEEWIESMQCRGKGLRMFCDNTKYSRYKTIQSLVFSLFEDKNGKHYDYIRDKWEMRQIISEVIAMVLFVEDETKV